MIIYKIENKINGKIYIGQTCHRVTDRVAGHMKNSSHLGNALRKYGIESFDIAVIDEAGTKDILNEKEKYWVLFFDCKHPRGYNLVDGGGGGSLPCDETKEKMRTSHLGKKLPENQKRKISISNIGRICSEETKKKISVKNSGKIRTDEAREKMRIAHVGKPSGRKGIPHTKETKIKMSKAAQDRKPNFLGKHHSKESKEKNRIAHLGKITSEQTKTLLRATHLGEKNHFYGKKHSLEAKEKMRMAKLRNQNINKERKEGN